MRLLLYSPSLQERFPSRYPVSLFLSCFQKFLKDDNRDNRFLLTTHSWIKGMVEIFFQSVTETRSAYHERCVRGEGHKIERNS